MPHGPSPTHAYKYLVQGEDDLASFSWVDSLTSDNYGILTVTIEDVADTITDVRPTPAASVSRLAVLPSIPNPFNPLTTIRYVLPVAGRATVTIYDARGRLRRRVFSGYQAGGL